MGLDDIIRDGVALANSVTADLQVTVLHAAWKSRDETGKPAYKPVVERKAVVEYRRRQVRLLNGTVVERKAVVTFLSPVDIDMRDKLTLPNGATGPILEVTGPPVDPETGETYAPEVWIG